MAKCPNCSARLDIRAASCPDCNATFSGSDSWKPLAETDEEGLVWGQPQPENSSLGRAIAVFFKVLLGSIAAIALAMFTPLGYLIGSFFTVVGANPFTALPLACVAFAFVCAVVSYLASRASSAL